VQGGPDWEGRIVLALHHLRRFPPGASFADDTEEENWEKIHAEFHRALISGCPSRVLLRFCAQLYDANRRYRHIARLTPRSRGNALSEHEQIGAAALARDVETATRLLIQHYTRTGDLLRSQISRCKKSA
jgi:DNA-binding GntR family transcriptional regulator